MTPVLRLHGITKRFGETLANDDVSLTLHRGETLALLGENGAGKSTLMGILFGHHAPDAGTIEVAGKTLPPGRPRAAIAAGIGMVHQHFSLAPNLTVLENVTCGTEPLWQLTSRKRRAREKLVEIAEKFGLRTDPDARVSDLSVGERQRVEILKALYNDARILILDEPTAVLTPAEGERLFATLRDMAAAGLSLIFISHKLGEVMGADRVVVLRAGRVVAERKTDQTDKGELAELMVGQRVARPVRGRAVPGDVILRARSVAGGPLRDVNFALRAGETLGIVGVSGNGQAALGRLLSGLMRMESGHLDLDGKPFPQGNVAAVMAAGIARIPEDRNAEGTIGEMTIWENAVLERAARFTRAGLVDRAGARRFADGVIGRFDLRGGGPDHAVAKLSGGNVQKLILGRNLMSVPRILIAAQPTRGLDEGAIAAVHRRLLEARKSGAGVLLISEDLDEVLALADRVQAIVAGRLSPPIAVEEADARKLGLMMSGEREDAV